MKWIFIALVLAGCSDPKPMDGEKFKAEFKGCVAFAGKGVGRPEIGSVLRECRAYATALASE